VKYGKLLTVFAFNIRRYKLELDDLLAVASDINPR
jgi:hypothetical protein